MLNINASIKTRFNRCHHSGDILKMILMRPEKVIPMKPESVIPSYQKMRSRWARICNNAISRINLEYPKFSGSLHGNDLEGEDKSGINWRTLGQSYAQSLQQEKWYLDSKLSLPQMAAKLATNDNYLSKAINTGLGKNFNRLINEVRTEHAKSLMRENQKTALLNIAYDSGFSSKASFNRAFREITGQTPSQFRSQIVNS